MFFVVRVKFELTGQEGRPVGLKVSIRNLTEVSFLDVDVESFKLFG